MALTAIGFLADGYTDPDYRRFTSPQQHALIVGTSRSGQGIQPAILNRLLKDEYRQNLFNFSFSAFSSPFGEVYLNAIQKKLDSSTNHSFFIVSVDPWSIAGPGMAPEDASGFIETKNGLNNNPWINTNPNFIYLARNYSQPYLTLLTGKIHRAFFHYRPPMYLHDDGWLESSIAMDSLSVSDRSSATFSRYQAYLDSFKISRTRIHWLGKTIAFLQRHGDVYMVRIPVSPPLLSLENGFCPYFNPLMDSIARQQGVPYFDFTGASAGYRYIDGSHLDRESSGRLSEELSQLIINYRHTR